MSLLILSVSCPPPPPPCHVPPTGASQPGQGALALWISAGASGEGATLFPSECRCLRLPVERRRGSICALAPAGTEPSGRALCVPDDASKRGAHRELLCFGGRLLREKRSYLNLCLRVPCDPFQCHFSEMSFNYPWGGRVGQPCKALGSMWSSPNPEPAEALPAWSASRAAVGHGATCGRLCKN